MSGLLGIARIMWVVGIGPRKAPDSGSINFYSIRDVECSFVCYMWIYMYVWMWSCIEKIQSDENTGRYGEVTVAVAETVPYFIGSLDKTHRIKQAR